MSTELSAAERAAMENAQRLVILDTSKRGVEIGFLAALAYARSNQPPAVVTEEMVEAAAKAMLVEEALDQNRTPEEAEARWRGYREDAKQPYRVNARRALLAALNTPDSPTVPAGELERIAMGKAAATEQAESCCCGHATSAKAAEPVAPTEEKPEPPSCCCDPQPFALLTDVPDGSHAKPVGVLAILPACMSETALDTGGGWFPAPCPQTKSPPLHLLHCVWLC